MDAGRLVAKETTTADFSNHDSVVARIDRPRRSALEKTERLRQHGDPLDRALDLQSREHVFARLMTASEMLQKLVVALRQQMDGERGFFDKPARQGAIFANGDRQGRGIETGLHHPTRHQGGIGAVAMRGKNKEAARNATKDGLPGGIRHTCVSKVLGGELATRAQSLRNRFQRASPPCFDTGGLRRQALDLPAAEVELCRPCCAVAVDGDRFDAGLHQGQHPWQLTFDDCP
jgi:hypothetical protein